MLFVHIGYHKTGSTAVQKWLLEHDDAVQRAGLLVPPSMSSWVGHPELAWVHLGRELPWQDRHYDRAEVLEWYGPYLELSRQRDVLLTSEEFCRLDEEPAALAALVSTLSPYEPRVFAYVRDPLRFSLSRYRHEVQSGSERRSVHEFLLNAGTLRSADFPRRTDQWRAAFPDACTFESYDEVMREDGSVLINFLSQFGVELAAAGSKAENSLPELKLHTSLLPVARLLATTNDNDERRGLFEDLFNLSLMLPEQPLDALLDAQGELIRNLYATIDMRRIWRDQSP